MANATKALMQVLQQEVNDRVPYLWAGVSQAGRDCSNLVSYAYNRIGEHIAGYTGTGHGTTSQVMATLGRGVKIGPKSNPLKNAKPGDILTFNEPGEGANSHVAIYAGDGMDYEESAPGQDAHLIPVETKYLSTIRQYMTTSGKATGNGITGIYNGDTYTTKLPKAVTSAVAGDTTTGTASLDSVTSGLTGDLTHAAVWLVGIAAGAGLVAIGVMHSAKGTRTSTSQTNQTGHPAAAAAAKKSMESDAADAALLA